MPAKPDLQVAAEMTAENSPSSLILSQDSYLDQLMKETDKNVTCEMKSSKVGCLGSQTDSAFVQAAGQSVLLVSEKGHLANQSDPD